MEALTGKAHEWTSKHEERILDLVRDRLPSGSGFDSGTQIDFKACRADRLVFSTAFHHMNDVGFYDGWTEHKVIIRPTFDGIDICVTGRNRNDIKDYIADCFYTALTEEV